MVVSLFRPVKIFKVGLLLLTTLPLPLSNSIIKQQALEFKKVYHHRNCHRAQT
jgi:hypothetical protein